MSQKLRLLLAGGAAGLTCGLFGAGGGMLLVPLLVPAPTPASDRICEITRPIATAIVTITLVMRANQRCMNMNSTPAKGVTRTLWRHPSPSANASRFPRNAGLPAARR